MVKRVFMLSYDPSKVSFEELDTLSRNIRPCFEEDDLIMIVPNHVNFSQYSLEELIQFRENIDMAIEALTGGEGL